MLGFERRPLDYESQPITSRPGLPPTISNYLNSLAFYYLRLSLAFVSRLTFVLSFQWTFNLGVNWRITPTKKFYRLHKIVQKTSSQAQMIFPVVKSIKIQNIITLSQNLPKQLPRLNLFKKLSVAVVQIISKVKKKRKKKKNNNIKGI